VSLRRAPRRCYALCYRVPVIDALAASAHFSHRVMHVRLQVSCAIETFQKHYTASQKTAMSLEQRQEMLKGIAAQAKQQGKEIDPSQVGAAMQMCTQLTTTNTYQYLLPSIIITAAATTTTTTTNAHHTTHHSPLTTDHHYHHYHHHHHDHHRPRHTRALAD
jgi:hypothetical protein